MNQAPTDVLAGWTWKGTNRFIGTDTIEATALIKDDTGKVLLDMHWLKKRRIENALEKPDDSGKPQK